jgi:hypothetical protein
VVRGRVRRIVTPAWLPYRSVQAPPDCDGCAGGNCCGDRRVVSCQRAPHLQGEPPRAACSREVLAWGHIGALNAATC